jgi:cell division protein FtsW
MVRLKKQKKQIDRALLFLTIILVLLGLVAVADASAPQAVSVFSDRFYFVKQQIVWAFFGVLSLLIVANIPYKFWENIALFVFIISVALLIVVLIPGFGTKTLGARRWLSLGPITIQPSEFVKLATALYFAKLSAKEKSILAYLVPLGLVFALIMLQPDLGTTLVVAAIGMVQVFASGISILTFLATLIGGGIISFILIVTSDYRRERFFTFIKQSQDPLGKSYHIRQVLLALGLGGFWGVGLGASRQKYLFLPEAATDSIFAIIAEEVGFLGASVLIILFAYFVYKAFKISSGAPDKFSKILGIGISTWIATQTLLNIGSMLALVPLTGIPLPFFSYGGSALVMLLIAVGILLNISKHETRTYVKRKK